MKNWLVPVFALMFTANAAFADADSRRERQAKISREEAQTIALKEVPGTVTDCDIEKPLRKPLQWVIDIKPNGTKNVKKEVRVDAMNGSVIGIKTDDDDDD